MTLLYHLASHVQYTLTKWRTISGNWLVSLVNKFVILFFVLSLAAIVWRWKLLPPQVPLWYAKPWGTEQLAHPYWLFILPLAGLFIYLVNILVSVYLTAELLVFTQILSLTSFLVNFLSLVTLVKILFLVT